MVMNMFGPPLYDCMIYIGWCKHLLKDKRPPTCYRRLLALHNDAQPTLRCKQLCSVWHLEVRHQVAFAVQDTQNHSRDEKFTVFVPRNWPLDFTQLLIFLRFIIWTFKKISHRRESTIFRAALYVSPYPGGYS